MNLFDKKGMLVIPNPKKTQPICEQEKLILVDECYCPNGHSLISKRAVFNGFKGIVFRVKRNGENGLVAISPVYGCKSRVSLNIDLEEGSIWNFHCPECDTEFPYYTSCICGANLNTIFTTKNGNFNHSISICNRVGCEHSNINAADDLLKQTMLEAH